MLLVGVALKKGLPLGMRSGRLAERLRFMAGAAAVEAGIGFCDLTFTLTGPPLVELPRSRACCSRSARRLPMPMALMLVVLVFCLESGRDLCVGASLASLQEELVLSPFPCEGVSETRLCVSSKPSSLSS